MFFLDASTTIQFLCNRLTKRATVYTNSLDNVELLADKSFLDVHLLGGKLHHKNRFFYSHSMLDQLQDIRFYTAILGVGGFSTDGIYSENLEDSLIKKAVSGCSKRTIVLAETVNF
ncbi:hypothetical protein QS257_12830 [Terrilactibacillus sp. S3-3]|nr:hypothetical protein QS257_12830 [Terrilactibacillus sp. S3-3]